MNINKDPKTSSTHSHHKEFKVQQKQQKQQLYSSSVKFQSTQKKLRDKAIAIKASLQKKKSSLNNEKIKEELIVQYQSKYEQFKQQIDIYTEMQLSSLELVKEFRLSEITEFEGRISEAVRLLEKQEAELQKKLKQVEADAENAVEFLETQKQERVKVMREDTEGELEKAVEEYQSSIQIE